ncbi:XdhC family protein [Alcaligenaceae bacterium C4P045]|nr:XdhC family protein [Alcaligenaceae bacterium C4P045]
MEDLDTQVLETIAVWRRAGLRAALVTIARTWGSSPRPPGSLMGINELGSTIGSVSGGCIEDDLILSVRNYGLSAVCRGDLPKLIRYGISADEAHRFGLPCGGTIELVIEPVTSVSGINDLLSASKQRRGMMRELNLRTGHVTLREGGCDGVATIDEHRLITYIGPQARLIVIGAGDMARFLCATAIGLGFEVMVCDPRESSAAWCMDGVTFSQEMPDDFIQRLRPDRRTAVVALSHDPKLDDLALIDALESDAFYVGAIGSRRNTANRRARLKIHFEIPDIRLNRLHGPAGMYIGSKTPAEIALSIISEIVAVKNGVKTGSWSDVELGKTKRMCAAPNAVGSS